MRQKNVVPGLALFGLLMGVGEVRGAAPVGRYTIASGAVTDEVTGLTWQRAVPATSYEWAEAQTYCLNLILAGKSDWRLPTKKELESIVDWRVAIPAIDISAFPETPAVLFWSSTRWTGSPSAFVVSFKDGRSESSDVRYAYRVRCVRCGRGHFASSTF